MSGLQARAEFLTIAPLAVGCLGSSLRIEFLLNQNHSQFNAFIQSQIIAFIVKTESSKCSTRGWVNRPISTSQRSQVRGKNGSVIGEGNVITRNHHLQSLELESGEGAGAASGDEEGSASGAGSSTGTVGSTSLFIG